MRQQRGLAHHLPPRQRSAYRAAANAKRSGQRAAGARISASATAPTCQSLEPWLLEFVRGSARPEWIWLVWRPALYFYLFLFGVAIKALPERDPSILLLAARWRVRMGVMFLLSINQDLRLHYPVIVIGTLYTPYLVGGRRGIRDS